MKEDAFDVPVCVSSLLAEMGRRNLSHRRYPAFNQVMVSNQILFLCTGNYYRSRYAEELFNFRTRTENLAWKAFSRGLAEKRSPENVGPISRLALQALQAKAIVPEGAARLPLPCSFSDFDQAQLVIALSEVEHRPMIELRFSEAAERVKYWYVDDIEFANPTIALAVIDDRVEELIQALGV